MIGQYYEKCWHVMTSPTMPNNAVGFPHCKGGACDMRRLKRWYDVIVVVVIDKILKSNISPQNDFEIIARIWCRADGLMKSYSLFSLTF